MKRLHLILLLSLLSLAPCLQAQEEAGEQLLVFRNTGAVDLLYTNEVDSVLTNDTTQVFYAKDTVLVVPLVELDSVAVGSRNEMVFHQGVKELNSNSDLPWIIRFDGTSIYYRKDTPAHVLPTVDMKLFCKMQTESEDVFPYGLCAKVTAVTPHTDEIQVDVEPVTLEDIFSKLFLAGPIYSEVDVPLSRTQAIRRAPVNADVNLGFTLPVEEVGSVEITGKLKVSGNACIGLRSQKADLNLEYGYGIGVTLEAKENTKSSKELLGPEQNVGSFYGLLNLQAAAGAFVDFAAELTFGMNLERTYKKKLLWERTGDDNTFVFRDANKDEPYEDKAQFDLTLNGDLFFGPMVRLDFVTIGDLVGARAKMKVGPEAEGKISLGMLHNMRNYQSEAYGNAELTVRSKVALECFTTHRRNLVWGEEEEHQIYQRDFPFAEHQMKLFPDYTHTNASGMQAKEKTVVVDMATALPEPTPTDIETGFEIVDPQGEVVDSVFVGTILAEPEDTTVAQTFDTEMVLPSTIKRDNLDGYTMRPVFHYAGYTISAAPVGIKKDVLLQLYTSAQSNGAMTFVSIGPFIGETTVDSTNYRMGTFLPVPLKKNIYRKREELSFNIGNYISDEQSSWIVGAWQGETDGQPLSVAFNDDGTGEWQEQPFNYTLNLPQSGELLLTSADGQQRVFRVESITENMLTLTDKRSHTSIRLSR